MVSAHCAFGHCPCHLRSRLSWTTTATCFNASSMRLQPRPQPACSIQALMEPPSRGGAPTKEHLKVEDQQRVWLAFC